MEISKRYTPWFHQARCNICLTNQQNSWMRLGNKLRWASGGSWLVTVMLLWGIATIYTLRRFYMLMRRTTISHFSFKRNFQTQSKDSMPTSQGNTDPIIARSDQHSPSPDPKRRREITIISFSRSICREELAALIGVTGKPYPRCLSCHSHPIRPCGAPSPRG